MVELDLVTDVMGSEGMGNLSMDSMAAMHDAISEGLPKSTLRITAKHLYPESSEQMKFIYRVVPEATFKRRKDRLSEAESERTERLARTIATAEYVLGDKEMARQFLTQPHPMLNGKSPIDTAMSELGARQVEQMLFGVFYGLPV